MRRIVRRGSCIPRRPRGPVSKTLTPPTHYVDGFVVVARRTRDRVLGGAAVGVLRSDETRIYGVDSNGGTPRTIVDRAGMNTGPKYSPDGQSIAFIRPAVAPTSWRRAA